MHVLILTVLVGCIYAEAAIEAWRNGEAETHHFLRETALAATYWLLAVSKYIDLMAYASHGMA